MTQAMNKKINAYMMAAMMAVVSPAIMGQTASDGVKVICNDVVQEGRLGIYRCRGDGK